MTVDEIMLNENIRSDRYAMAAISFIFNAFGDPIRSKEYWPWGEKVQCAWRPTKGTDIDISYAKLLLERARIKYEEEISENEENYKINTNIVMDDLRKNIKQLQNRLNRVKINVKNIVSATSELNNINDNTQKTVNDITNTEETNQ